MHIGLSVNVLCFTVEIFEIFPEILSALIHTYRLLVTVCPLISISRHSEMVYHHKYIKNS